ncbi:hypothetical protein J7W08_10010 [Methanococcoides orientis]|uniref:hypothetical protein n=1 Tax=Methanococcoides orientis TaxID=2822137 RepID=UPI001E451B05|nr:hypothetical protein [Methanococcoides orientis]UGV40397.1 hypothetical protein J7W08_10010 [Methanococcoides orientis]
MSELNILSKSMKEDSLTISKVGASLLVLAGGIAAVYVVVVILSNFAGIFPEWYDYQPWYPHYPGGLEGRSMNIALLLWASFSIITLVGGLKAFFSRDPVFPTIGTIIAIFLIIFAIIVAGSITAVLWGFLSFILALFGAILVGLGSREFDTYLSFKIEYLLRGSLISIGIAAFFLLFYAVLGFTAAPEGYLAPLSRRLASGFMALLAFGLCLTAVHFIRKRTHLKLVISTLLLVIPLSFMTVFLVLLGEWLTTLFLLVWLPVITSAILIATCKKKFTNHGS